jgi:murein DD-endopeptidase MepM/ murein hydrolase activator NlpD
MFTVVPGGTFRAGITAFGCRVREGFGPGGRDTGGCPVGRQFHNGVDIGAPVGTPVHAVQYGRVLAVKTDGQWSGYGNVVVVEHTGDTRASLYAHLSQALVREGDRVSQNQVIGMVGATHAPLTGHMGPHLHLEIHATPTRSVNPRSPRRLNPITYLRIQNMRVADFGRGLRTH